MIIWVRYVLAIAEGVLVVTERVLVVTVRILIVPIRILILIVLVTIDQMREGSVEIFDKTRVSLDKRLHPAYGHIAPYVSEEIRISTTYGQ